MNYDIYNKIYDKLRVDVFPNLRSLATVIDFEDYMHKVHSSEKLLRQYRLFPIPYFVKAKEFMEQHKKKCVSYWSPSDPAKEGSMGIVYQFSPTLHVWARLHNWAENEGNTLIFHLTLAVAFIDYDDFLKVADDTYVNRMEGNTDDTTPKGFGGFR